MVNNWQKGWQKVFESVSIFLDVCLVQNSQ